MCYHVSLSLLLLLLNSGVWDGKKRQALRIYGGFITFLLMLYQMITELVIQQQKFILFLL